MQNREPDDGAATTEQRGHWSGELHCVSLLSFHQKGLSSQEGEEAFFWAAQNRDFFLFIFF